MVTELALSRASPLPHWTESVTDISPIRALRGLKSLRVNGRRLRWGKLADLSPLAGMNLVRFNCDYTEVADLSPLEGMLLMMLHCTGTKVRDGGLSGKCLA